MDRTPRRRRNSYEYDKPNMSEDHDSGTGEETDEEELERLRRENEELRRRMEGLRRGNIKEEEQERRTVNLAARGGTVLAVGGLAALSLVTLGASMLVQVMGTSVATGVAFMIYINSITER